MVRKKARSQIMVADGAGGMMKLQDRRFEKGDWPISFEIPVAGEQAERWSRYLKWGCHKRGWSPASLGQLDRQENSGTVTVTGNAAPKLDIVWEHRRDRPLKVRARLAAASCLSLADAEQFFRDINNDCSRAVTTPLYFRGTLQYERGLAWLGEHWLDDETRLAPPSLQDQLSLQNGARIVHIDALLPCVGEPDVIYMRQQVLNEISLFLSGCQRTSVAGLKTTAASSKEGNSRYSQTKIKRSAERSLSLASADRCSTTSCWRRNAISASRAACDLNTPPSSLRRSIIPAMRVAHRSSCASPDAIFGSHRLRWPAWLTLSARSSHGGGVAGRPKARLVTGLKHMLGHVRSLIELTSPRRIYVSLPRTRQA